MTVTHIVAFACGVVTAIGLEIVASIVRDHRHRRATTVPESHHDALHVNVNTEVNEGRARPYGSFQDVRINLVGRRAYLTFLGDGEFYIMPLPSKQKLATFDEPLIHACGPTTDRFDDDDYAERLSEILDIATDRVQLIHEFPGTYLQLVEPPSA